MLKRSQIVIVWGIVLLGHPIMADTLMLKDGRVIQGIFKSGTTSAITFESEGATQTYPVETIMSVTFQRTAPKPEPKPAPPAVQPQATPQSSSPGPITLSAGTRLMIKTQMTVTTDKAKSGDRFTAALETDLVVNDIVVAPKGSTVYGRVAEANKAKRIRGKAKLVLELTDVMINDQLFPIVTDQIGYEGERSGALKKVAAGAAVGGIADGSDGARTGAAVGAGAAVLSKGNQIEIPAGSILEFKTTQPLTVPE
jgi:hypothetical protein